MLSNKTGEDSDAAFAELLASSHDTFIEKSNRKDVVIGSIEMFKSRNTSVEGQLESNSEVVDEVITGLVGEFGEAKLHNMSDKEFFELYRSRAG